MARARSHTEFEKMLHDYRLTTAEILYHIPDHPHILQTYLWQELDLAPKYPVLHRFLLFWERELDGKLHSVKVANVGIINPAELKHGSEFYIH